MAAWPFNSGISTTDSNRALLMLIARNLRTDHSSNREHWRWVRSSNGFEVHGGSGTAKSLVAGNSGKNKIRNLRGLDTFQEASVVYSSMSCKTVVCLNPRVARPRNKCVELPVRRSDGWMELELVRFYCNDGPGDLEAVVTLTKSDDEKEKTGLVVAGIELRPF